MSEDVKIVQFGSLPEYQLPDWATEKTLDKIRDSMEKDLDLTEDTKRLLNNIFEQIKATKTISSKQLKEMSSVGGSPGAIRKTVAGLDDFRDSAAEVADSNTHFAKTTLKGAKDVNKGLHLLAMAKIAWLPLLYGLQRQTRMMLTEYTNTTQMFRTLHGRGIAYSGTVVDLRTKLAASGTSIEQFGGIMEKYGVAINRTGIDRFYKMNREMERLGDSIRESRFILADYGLVHQEAAEFHGAYLEQQRLMGTLRAMDERELRAGMEQQIKSLTGLSKLMNKSREEILEDKMKMKGDPDITRMLASMSPAQAKAVGEALGHGTTAFSASGMQEQIPMLKDMMVHLAPEASASYQSLMASGQIVMGKFLADMSRKMRAGVVQSPEEIFHQLTTQLVPELGSAFRSGMYESLATASQENREEANKSAVALRNLNTAIDNSINFLGTDGRLDLGAMAKSTQAELTAFTAASSKTNQFTETKILASLKLVEDILGDPQIGMAARMQDFTNILAFGVDSLNTIFQISPDGMKEAISKRRALALGAGAAVTALVVGGAARKFVPMVLGSLGLGRGLGAVTAGAQGDLFAGGGGGGGRGRAGMLGRAGMGRLGMGGILGLGALGTGMLTDYLVGNASSSGSAQAGAAIGGIAQGALTGAAFGSLFGVPGMLIGGAAGAGLAGLQAYNNKGQIRQPGEIPTGVDRAQERYLEDAQKSQINTERNAEESKNQLVAINRNIERLASEVATIKSLYRAEVASGGGLARTQG